jgi:zinc transport system substrate-binding protein
MKKIFAFFASSRLQSGSNGYWRSVAASRSNRRNQMRFQSALVVTIIVALIGCGGGPASDQPAEAPESVDKLVIYTVNYPLAYFAERIGNDLVEVHFPAPGDEDPAFWSPDTDTIAAYQAADLILLNGAGYAKWVGRAALPSSRLINTSQGFSNRLLPLQGIVTHSHGPEGEHEHQGYAFTTWLDPELATLQAQTIAASIALQRPEQESDIQRRLEDLRGDLLDIGSRLQVAGETLGDTPLLFSHPVYQYLISRYGLNGVEVHWEPDQVPTGHAWEHLQEVLGTHPAKWMVWEGDPLEAMVAGLAEVGVGSVVFDPCGNRPGDGDFLSVMAANAVALEGLAGSNAH